MTRGLCCRNVKSWKLLECRSRDRTRHRRRNRQAVILEAVILICDMKLHATGDICALLVQ